VQLQLAQGALDIRVRGFDANQVLEIDTPNLAFSILRPGNYRIEVDPAGNATTVVTRSGQAEVYGENAAYAVNAGAAYRFYGTGLVDYELLAQPGSDELDRWAVERDRRWDTSVSARYVSPDVIGYQDLDANGVWRVEAGYGNVWVPNRVVIGWAPYRDGYWTWIDPWGWTWVDNAPWGFAVSHYGRWAHVRNTWCWVPGPVRARAVYAPALVVFVGGSNFQVAIAAGSGGAIGWFPLGPRDVYRPAYPVSRTYFNNVNTTNTVINVTNITNVYNNRNVTNVTYANQRVPGAVVAVPTTTFVQAQPVSRAALRLAPEAVIKAQVSPIAAVAPTPVSVRGPAQPGRQPPAQVLDRQMIAKTAPPPAPVPFATKERVLAENPGKPLDRSTMGTLKPFVPVPAPKIQLVTPAQTAGPAAAPPTPRGQPEQRAKAGQRGEPAAPGTAPQQGLPPAQAVPPQQRGRPPVTAGQPPASAVAPAESVSPPPQQRGQPPLTAGQPPASMVAPAPPPSESRGKSQSRAQPPVAVSPPPAVAPAPVQPLPEQRGRSEPPRGQPPAVVSPPSAVAPAPVQPLPEQRGRSEPPRGQPPTVAAPPPAPAMVPPVQRAQPESRGKPEPAQPSAAAPAPPPAQVPTPPVQRAQPEPRGRPAPAQPSTAAPAPPPAAVPVPPVQRAQPEPRGKPAPAQVARPDAPPAPPPPANVEQRGGGKPPPPAKQDKKSPEQQKADEEEKKRK
jgi:hypothetical protein